MSQTLLPIASARFTWSKLWSILRQSPRRLTLILVLFVASSLTVITTPIVIGKVIDRAYAGELAAFPWIALGVITLAVIADALLERTWNFQSQILGTRLNQELSVQSMEAALSLNAQTIEDAGSGDLLTRVTTDIDAVRQSVTDGIPRITLVVVYLGVTTVTLFTLSPVIGLVIIPMLIAMWFLLKTFLPKIAEKVITKTQRTSELTTAVTENVRGLQTIKELDIHQERHQVFTAKNHNVYQQQQNLVTLRSTLWGLDSLSSYTPLLLTLIWGSYAVTQSWTSRGAVSSAAILVFSLRRYTDEFSFWLDRLRESTITMGRIFGIIELAEHQK
ncbi:MAG: ABC transporter ATP-binding protein, partial [Rothia sp. (in: high G+C Gram-positive bacteria)]|nr:ABC transporter ATP-binding protein [Rothia sp. (in: high G+C Gram-positive bacteria)]